MHYKKERKADSVLLLHAFSFLVSNGFEAQQVQYWGICVWDTPFSFSKTIQELFLIAKIITHPGAWYRLLFLGCNNISGIYTSPSTMCINPGNSFFGTTTYSG